MTALIVSFCFPPNNVVGAVRVGKLAKYLYERGHRVRVVCGSYGSDNTLPVEIPAGDVLCASHFEVDRIFDPLVRLLRWPFRSQSGQASAEPARSIPTSKPSAPRGLLRRHYYAALQVPDSKVGWMPAALMAGRHAIAQARPDVVFASGPPFTSLLVARRLAREARAPLVCELRDLWTENPYYEYPGWRRRVDRLLERHVMAGANGLVATSPLAASRLAAVYNKPSIAIFNGFAEEDFPPRNGTLKAGGPLRVVYTGNIYRGFRDPSVLFEAMALLGEDGRNIMVEFYGPAIDEVRPLADSFGVASQIRIQPRVPYRESLALQRDADVLLLMQWNDPRDAVSIPAKLFEYLGARRPILFHGYEGGTIADIIRERGAGLASNNPSLVASQLSRWLTEKRAGAIPDLPLEARAGLSRTEQFRELEDFLAAIRLDPDVKAEGVRA